METNQTTQATPPVLPEPQSGHKMAYMIVGLFVLIVLAAVAVPFTLNVFKKGNQTAIDKQIVAEDTKILDNYRGSSSVEAQEAYVKAADERLAEGDMSDGARNLILLRKAAVLSQARGDAESLAKKTAEATQIYLDLINKPNPTDSDLYFRDFSIVALTRLNLQCCQMTSNIMDASPVFSDSYKMYTEAGYSKSIASLLALDVATGKMSKARGSDAMNRLNSMDIAAKLLSGYYDELQEGTREALIKELGDGLASYPNLKPQTYNDPSNIFEAGNKLAIAHDWYKSLSAGGKTAEVNAQIDRQYEDAQAAISAAQSKISDKHAMDELTFYNQLYYLESLDRRYPDGVMTDKKNVAITTLLELLKNTVTIGDIGKLYFRGLQEWKTTNPDEVKKFAAFTHFVSLGKENADIAAYLKSINVTP